MSNLCDVASNNNKLMKANVCGVNKEKTNDIKVSKATVINVNSDYSYATVKLVGNNETIITLLNKTGEKLEIGDGVRIFYNTDISCGWIAVRNGKPSPIGGGNLTIDSAAVIPTSAESTYLQDAEVFNIDVKNQIKVAYGDRRNRVIINGYLMPVYYDLPECHATLWQFVMNSDDFENYRANSLGGRIYSYDLTEEQRKFFEDNIDCVISEIDISSTSTFTSYIYKAHATSVTYNGNTYESTECILKLAYDSKNESGRHFQSRIRQTPVTFGILPVVIGYSKTTSRISITVRLCLVSYDGYNNLIDVVNMNAGTPFFDGKYTTTITEAEDNYYNNILTKSEIKPSDNS